MNISLINIKEKMKQNKIAYSVVAILIALLITFVALLAANVIDLSDATRSDGFVNDINSDVNGTNQLAQVFGSQGLLVSGDGANNITDAEAAAFANTMIVRYPVLSNPDLFDYEGEENTCADEIAWATTRVARSPQILNVTMRVMFAGGTDFGFEPGNFVGDQNSLKFNNANIENSVAKIYLTGEIESNETCDPARVFTQIESAAMQFDTVKAVQIYLNGDLLR